MRDHRCDPFSACSGSPAACDDTAMSSIVNDNKIFFIIVIELVLVSGCKSTLFILYDQENTIKSPVNVFIFLENGGSEVPAFMLIFLRKKKKTGKNLRD